MLRPLLHFLGHNEFASLGLPLLPHPQGKPIALGINKANQRVAIVLEDWVRHHYPLFEHGWQQETTNSLVAEKETASHAAVDEARL